MSDFYDSVKETLTEADKRYTEIDDAIDYVWSSVARKPELVEGFARKGIRAYLHEVTHKRHQRMRDAVFNPPAPKHNKVLAGSVVNQIAEETWLASYQIRGHVLGSIEGSALLELADAEQAIADGCAFNADLLRNLSKKVPADKLVRDCVTERQVVNMVKKIRGGQTKKVG